MEEKVIKISSGKEFKIREFSMEQGFEIDKIYKDGNMTSQQRANKILQMCMIEPPYKESITKELSLKEGTELITEINKLNGIGDFTQSQESSPQPKDGKDTTS